jgi:hypothetical protein
MLDLGHEKVVACDAIFGTNDKKVFSPISPSMFHLLQDQHGFLTIECFAYHNFLNTLMVFDEHGKIGIPVTWNVFV